MSAADIDTNSARRALQSAMNALDNGNPVAAEQWSETAADIIREARFEPDDLRALVAPVDGPTTGDAAIVGISLAVIIWIAFDALRVLL